LTHSPYYKSVDISSTAINAAFYSALLQAASLVP